MLGGEKASEAKQVNLVGPPDVDVDHRAGYPNVELGTAWHWPSKEQFKTAKGKYVVPALIENLLAENLDIEQICVIGQGRKQPIALVVMNQQNKVQTSSNTRALQQTLARTNSRLESHQKLDNIVVLKEDWTTNDFLTPTLKIKRMEIETAFQHYLEQDFSELVFWE